MTSKSAEIRRLAKTKGKKLAVRWRQFQRVPRKPFHYFCELIAEQTAHDLSCVDDVFRGRLHSKLKVEYVVAFLGYDPRGESPPENLTDYCPACKLLNPPGRVSCKNCGQQLTLISKYDVWVNALVITHHLASHQLVGGDLFNYTVNCLPEMRPYPQEHVKEQAEAWEAAYAITHLDYILNDYNKHKLSTTGLETEYQFLKKVLGQAEQALDYDLLGECIDSLSSFGLSRNGLILKKPIERLTKAQNFDGSWGCLESDPHRRIHTTWTAIDAIREYRWCETKVSLKEQVNY